MEVMSQPTAPRPSAWAPPSPRTGPKFGPSRRCPPERMLMAFDWARSLPEEGTVLVGGFHSPIEQECLAIALRRHLPVIVCTARSFSRMRPATEWRRTVDDGRMLILSTFSPSARRLTEERSVERNHFAAALAEEICFVHAEPGGHAESLRNLAVSWGKTLKVLV